MCLAIPQKHKEILLHIPSFLKYGRDNYLPRFVLAFVLCIGKLSMRKLGQEVLTEQRNKANVNRTFNNPEFDTHQAYWRFFELFFRQQILSFPVQWLVIFDTTTKKTQRRWHRRKRNRGRGGKRRLRNRNGNTIKYKDRGKRGKGSQTHLWVLGLLITESGTRIPLPRRSYYTKAYAKRHGLKYRSQVDLVVEMLSELRVPENVELIVLADSFFEGKKLDQLCSKVLLTNNCQLTAKQIVEPYKLRWEIELYSKYSKSFGEESSPSYGCYLTLTRSSRLVGIPPWRSPRKRRDININVPPHARHFNVGLGPSNPIWGAKAPKP